MFFLLWGGGEGVGAHTWKHICTATQPDNASNRCPWVKSLSKDQGTRKRGNT